MRRLDTPLGELLGVRFAIVQSPMAFVQPPSLAVEVSNAGALGFVAGAPFSPDELRAAIREVRDGTTGPFGVNLFAPLERTPATDEQVAAIEAYLAPHRERAGLEPPAPPAFPPWTFDDQLAVVLEEKPTVFASTFGVVDVAPLHDAGILVLGTATTVAEAKAQAHAGVDAIVLQGAEAGGHRGAFLDGGGVVPLLELVRETVAAIPTPVIAAGGIVDGAGIAEAIDLGAQAAQLGTAFLFTPECATPRAWLDALRDFDTVVTSSYSGRPARAAQTPFVEELDAGPQPLPYPLQRGAIGELAAVDGYGLYLGGTGARRAREMPVAQLIRTLAVETELA